MGLFSSIHKYSLLASCCPKNYLVIQTELLTYGRVFLTLLVLLGTGCGGGSSSSGAPPQAPSGLSNVITLETNLTAVSDSPTSVILHWMNPTNGELQSLSFSYSYRNGTDTVPLLDLLDITSPARLRAGAQITYRVPNLLVGVNYIFTIRGTIRRDSQVYNFSLTSARAFTLVEVDRTKKITNLTAVSDSPTSVVLRWMNPADANLQFLFLSYSYGDGLDTVTVPAFDITSAERLRAAAQITYRVPNLLADTNYIFNISGIGLRDAQLVRLSSASVRVSTPRVSTPGEDLSQLSMINFCTRSLEPDFVPAVSNTSVGLSAARFGDDSSLHLQFNGSVRVTDTGRLYVMPRGAEAGPGRFGWRIDNFDSFAIPVANVTTVGDNLVVVPSVRHSFFVPPSAISQRSPQLETGNLRWDVPYAICNRGMITDTLGNDLPNVLGSFTTAPPPPLLAYRSQFNASQLVYSTTESELRFYYNLVREPIYYNFTSAVRLLNGTGVRISVYDEGIWLINPDVEPGLAFRAIDVADELRGVTPGFLREIRDLGHTLNTTFNHATWMARFVLDFAPGAALYDFPFSAALSHLSVEIGAALDRYGIIRRPAFVQDPFFNFEEYAQLATALNVSIFSHSAGSNIDNITVRKLGDQIRRGLVYSKSLGNDNSTPNTIADQHCSDDLVFLPYMTNLSAGQGAFVTLQAASDNPLSLGASNVMPRTIRTHAGDAANYTLTMWETGGAGATSQAAASFSGMVALMLQANEKYDANFSPRQLVEIMMETADSVPGNRTAFGHGFVNMGRAVKRVQDGIAPTFKLYEDVASSPLFLNHGFALNDTAQNDCVANR